MYMVSLFKISEKLINFNCRKLFNNECQLKTFTQEDDLDTISQDHTDIDKVIPDMQFYRRTRITFIYKLRISFIFYLK